jgi:hypothetical protein
MALGVEAVTAPLAGCAGLFELTAIDPLTLAFAIDESAPDLTLTLRHRRR